MSPALIHGKVDIAIARLGLAGPLVDAWREVATRYGAGSNPALGCLLALMREAWGATPVLVSIYGDGAFMEIGQRGACEFEVDAPSLVVALVEALESAPTKVGEA